MNALLTFAVLLQASDVVFGFISLPTQNPGKCVIPYDNKMTTNRVNSQLEIKTCFALVSVLPTYELRVPDSNEFLYLVTDPKLIQTDAKAHCQRQYAGRLADVSSSERLT